jgi:hypothetical protein
VLSQVGLNSWLFAYLRASYSLEFETNKLFLPGYKDTIKDVQNRPWTVTVSFRGIKAYHESPNGKTPYDTIREYPADYPFWTGDLTAQIVNTPK